MNITVTDRQQLNPIKARINEALADIGQGINFGASLYPAENDRLALEVRKRKANGSFTGAALVRVSFTVEGGLRYTAPDSLPAALKKLNWHALILGVSD